MSAVGGRTAGHLIVFPVRHHVKAYGPAISRIVTLARDSGESGEKAASVTVKSVNAASGPNSNLARPQHTIGVSDSLVPADTGDEGIDMFLPKSAGRALLATACASVAAVGLAAPASGYAINISSTGSTGMNGRDCGTFMCLFYSPNMQQAGWRPTWSADSDLAGNRFHNNGMSGDEQVVRNNAASMGNNAWNCQLSTYVYTSYRGNSNYLAYHVRWGNLSSGLRNNEASIRVVSCT